MMRRTAVDMEQAENLTDENNFTYSSTKYNACMTLSLFFSHLGFCFLGYYLRVIQEGTVCGDGSNL